MSSDRDKKRPPGKWSKNWGTNYDFGWLDDDGLIHSMNHGYNPPDNPNVKGSPGKYWTRNKIETRMSKVYIKTIDEWEEGSDLPPDERYYGNIDFNGQVWCTACNSGN